MSHCPYLLHKSTYLTIILCALFIRDTDCSITVSQSFTGAAAPCPHTYIIVIIKMIETYNIAAQPYYCWRIYAETIALRAPLTHLSSEKKMLRTSYVQSVMQQYESTKELL